MAADAGVAAHPFRGRQGVLGESLEPRAERPGLAGDAPGVLDLTEDLRFAQHHRVETGRDPHRVARRRLVAVDVARALQAWRLDAVIGAEPVCQVPRFPLRCPAVELGAVARGQDGRLRQLGRAAELAQRLGELLRRESHPLAELHGRGEMVEAVREQAHGPLRAASAWTVCSDYTNPRAALPALSGAIVRECAMMPA